MDLTKNIHELEIIYGLCLISICFIFSCLIIMEALQKGIQFTISTIVGLFALLVGFYYGIVYLLEGLNKTNSQKKVLKKVKRNAKNSKTLVA